MQSETRASQFIHVQPLTGMMVDVDIRLTIACRCFVTKSMSNVYSQVVHVGVVTKQSAVNLTQAIVRQIPETSKFNVCLIVVF